jgi:glycosyltransferase involved in cell wall biosynthesis
MSRIDIVVPCYNYGCFLRECIESVLSQPVDFRVLIIDDASPDDTEKIAKELVAQDDRVEYRRHPVNKGFIATLNEGLEWVTGEYNLALSADDALVAGALARAIHLLDAEPGVGFVFGKAICFPSSCSKPLPRTTSVHCSWNTIKGLEFIEESCSQGLNLVYSPTAIIRTSLLRQVGSYRPNLPQACDMAMWLKYAAYADVGILDAEQGYYRIHGDNMHLRHFKMDHLMDARQRIAAFETLFKDAGHRLPNVEILRDKALNAIARQSLNSANVNFYQGNVGYCRELMEFAVTCWPEAAHQKMYRRLKVKLWFGPSAWTNLRRLTFRARSS